MHLCGETAHVYPVCSHRADDPERALWGATHVGNTAAGWFTFSIINDAKLVWEEEGCTGIDSCSSACSGMMWKWVRGVCTQLSCEKTSLRFKM